MVLAFRPFGGVMLGLESCEHTIGMILDNVVSDRATIEPALRTCFDVNVRHCLLPCQPLEMAWAAPAGGRAYNPSNFGIGADPGHQEQRSPSTKVPTEANGWRSMVLRSIARLVPQPGQKTSSQGVPASSAARIVGDHSIVAAGCQAPIRAINDEFGLFARGPIRLELGGASLDVESSVRTPIRDHPLCCRRSSVRRHA
jgi:hypothetical protein